MAERDLRSAIREARDTVAIIGTLIVAGGIGLKWRGLDPGTIVSALSGSAVLVVLLWWVRLRLFPTWRFLELTLKPNRRLAGTRSLPPFLWCVGRAWRHGLSTRFVARLRAEADILAEADRLTDTEVRWRAHFARMMDAWETARWRGPDAAPFTTEVEDCIPLTERAVFERVDAYFDALRRTRVHHDRFLSSVTVKSAYLAPLHLLGGQLAFFKDTWRSVLDGYAAATAPGDPLLDAELRRLRAFQFACWIAWGPSIPICTCSQWNEAERGGVGFQFGYGDENTSVVLYDESPRLREAFRRARQQARASMPVGAPAARAPLAFEVVATARIRRSSSVADTICLVERPVCAPESQRLVLQHESLHVGNRPRRNYYSAYLWVMFVVEARPGVPLCDKAEPWRALLPFFVHGNIAEPETYAFLKRRLALGVLDSLDAVCQRGGLGEATFAYVCAIDDSGCGFALDCQEPADAEVAAASIAGMLEEALRTRYPGLAGRVRLPRETREARAPDGRWYAELYSACHLPERIEEYFAWLQRARQPEAPPRGSADA